MSLGIGQLESLENGDRKWYSLMHFVEKCVRTFSENMATWFFIEGLQIQSGRLEVILLYFWEVLSPTNPVSAGSILIAVCI